MKSKSHSVYYCAFVVAFGAFILGLDAALISGTIKFVGAEFALSDMQIGTMVSAPGLAVLFALMFTGYVCDWIGRKKTLIIISFVYIFSAVFSTFSPNYETLVIARFVGGLAFTSLSVAAMYIGEIAPPEKRGRLVSLVQISIVVGFSAAYFANYALLQLSQSDLSWVQSFGLNQNTWRWMLGLEIVPAIIWFLLLFTIPQSPRWLVMKGEDAKAKKILAEFESQTSAEQELLQIKESIAHTSISHTFVESFKKLFESRLRMAVILALTFAVVQQVTGINAILFYAPTVFEQIGVGTDAAFFNAVIVGVIGVVATTLAVFTIDRIGRRPMVIWGLASATICLCICFIGFNNADYKLTSEFVTQYQMTHALTGLETLANQVFSTDVEFKQALLTVMDPTTLRLHESALLQNAANINVWLIVGAILGFIFAFNYTIGPVLWVLFSEIFPTDVRGVAIPTFALISSAVSYLVQQFFPWLLTNLGAAHLFLFYTLCGLVGLVLLYRIMPETKGKTIEEIEQLLSKKGQNKSLASTAVISES
ncbi:sugar porter family MFS transporter [Thalassotalea piscium]